MIDWPGGASAVRLRLPLPPARPLAAGALAGPGAAAAPWAGAAAARPIAALEPLAPDWLFAEQPAASRQAPAVRTPAQAASLRRAGETVLGGAVMPIGRGHR